MTTRMAGDVEYVEIESEFGQCDVITAGHRLRGAGDVFERRGNDGHGVSSRQFGDAAGVIAMMVGDEDGAEAVAGCGQMLENRRRVTRVDDSDGSVTAQAPDIVVLEGGQRKYFHGFHRQRL